VYLRPYPTRPGTFGRLIAVNQISEGCLNSSTDLDLAMVLDANFLQGFYASG
jgi:hypothetical protein